MTGLSFLVTSGNPINVDYFNEITFPYQYTPDDLLIEIKKEVNNTPLLKDCKEIVVVYSNTTYTLVPESLFDETKLSEYLKFNSKILLGDFLTHDPLKKPPLHVVYVPYVNINNYFFETFGSFQYFHALTILVDALQKIEKNPMGDKAYLHIQKDHFDLVLWKNGQLALCNSYPFKTPEDVLYYVLFALEQTKLNPDSIETAVLGNIDEKDTYFELLYTYIRNITVLDRALGIHLDDSAPHHHFLLKNIP